MQTQNKVPHVQTDKPEVPVSEEIKQPPLIKKMPEKKIKKYALPGLLAVLVVFAGIGTGWVLASPKSSSATPDVAGTKNNDNPKEAGIDDEELFGDTAEGVLEEGGIDGEGTHHLDTGFGPEKYVYMTSTVIDLDSFIGKKVKVWGQTSAGQKAGWLMDVGKVKVIE